MSNTTRILKGDLDPTLHWAFENTKKSILEDLEKLSNSRDKDVSQIIKDVEIRSKILEGAFPAEESFEYETSYGSKDIYKHTYSGIINYTEIYEYGIVNIDGEDTKVIVRSIREEALSNVLVIKEYTYDEEGDIISISTTLEDNSQNI